MSEKFNTIAKVRIVATREDLDRYIAESRYFTNVIRGLDHDWLHGRDLDFIAAMDEAWPLIREKLRDRGIVD